MPTRSWVLRRTTDTVAVSPTRRLASAGLSAAVIPRRSPAGTDGAPEGSITAPGGAGRAGAAGGFASGEGVGEGAGAGVGVGPGIGTGASGGSSGSPKSGGRALGTRPRSAEPPESDP